MAGPDCSGKTTNVPFVADLLRNQGHEVVTCRVPGGTPMAEKIRNLVLSENLPDDPILPKTELLLFAAARRQLYDSFIKPNVDQGKIVVCDRFSESAFAYQGYAKNLMKDALTLEEKLFDDVVVDSYLFFDVSHEVATARKSARNKEFNRLNLHEEVFHKAVHDGYKYWRYSFDAQLSPSINRTRLNIFDANKELHEVQEQLKHWVENVFPKELDYVRNCRVLG